MPPPEPWAPLPEVVCTVLKTRPGWWPMYSMMSSSPPAGQSLLFEHQKLLYPVLMLAYFALMVPHKALLSLLILQQMSVLFMPLLYLCFGTVLDLMVFVALYSWLASLAPADAVADAG